VAPRRDLPRVAGSVQAEHFLAMLEYASARRSFEIMTTMREVHGRAHCLAVVKKLTITH